MARPQVFAADTPPAVLREWIAMAQAAPHFGRLVLPILRRDPPPPEPPLPLLFEDLPDQRRGEPAPVPPASVPEPAVELDPRDFPNAALMSRIVGDVLPPPSALAVTRRRLKRERAEAAAAAREAEVAPVEPDPSPTAPALVLTMDMGPLHKAHRRDRTDPADRFDVACPPFHLHDEEHVEPIDEFLGQVVAFVTDTRALLFRRRDPDVMDGCKVGQRYVLMRFHDDKEGQAWSMPVDGEDDAAVLTAIRTTMALYRWSQRGSPQI